MNNDGYPAGPSPYPKNSSFKQRLLGSPDVPTPDEWNEWGVHEFKAKYPPGKKENKPWYASHIYGRLDEGTMSEGGMGSIDRWFNVQDLIDYGMMDELQKPDDSISDEAWQRKKIKKAHYVQKNEKYGLSRQMEEDDPELFESLELSEGNNPQYDLGKSATQKFAQKATKQEKRAASKAAKKAVSKGNDTASQVSDALNSFFGGKKKKKKKSK